MFVSLEELTRAVAEYHNDEDYKSWEHMAETLLRSIAENKESDRQKQKRRQGFPEWMIRLGD